jgi:hypothetical protein
MDVSTLAEQDQADQRKKKREDKAGHHFGSLVITSEAKQSISPEKKEWIASSLRSLAQTLRVCRRQ